MARCMVRITIAVMVGMAMTVLVAVACARWSRPMAFSEGGIRNVEDDSRELEWFSILPFPGVPLSYPHAQIDPADLDQSPSYLRDLQVLGRWMPPRQLDAPLSDVAGCSGIAGYGVLWMHATRNEHFEIPTGHLSNPIIVRSHEMIEKQYGWPLLCLSSGVHEINPTRFGSALLSWSDIERDCIARYFGRGTSSSAAPALDWPRAILWPGFIANTFIFCGPWLLFIFMTEGRTWLRYRRGHCPICAYDLRSDFARGCPECGWGREAE